MRKYTLALTMGACLAAALAPPGAAWAQPADPAIAYIGTQGSTTNKLVVMNADGSNATAIYTPSGANINDPTWSPTGTQIAFHLMNNTTSRGLWRIDVAVVNNKPKGLNPTQLTMNLYGKDPAWSPVGDRIAFVDITNYPVSTLQVVAATGGVATVLFTGSVGIYSPKWSSDATQIAFFEYDASFYGRRIRVLDVETGVVTTALSDDFLAQFAGGFAFSQWGLDWARTGDVLAFGVGTLAVYQLDLAGGPPTLAVDGAVQPTWSPADSSIVYRDIDGGSRLRRINLSTGAITTFGSTIKGRDPDWRRF